MRKKLTSNKFLEFFLVALVFVIVLSWSLITPMPGGPDEYMRYSVARYLYENPGTLPRGDDPAILDGIWGISYGFFPILSYMVSAVFMWIAGAFSTSPDVLLHAARLADVLFITVAAHLTIRIGRRLFKKGRRWLFTVLVIFLPEFLFMGTYVNTDSLALMAVAIILLAWVRCLDQGWTWKNCILLGVGIGICFLSYYNAYGWILWSVFFFGATVLFCSSMPWKERWKFLFSRGLAIAGISLGISGWWFIRNYRLYDGDFLGRKACNICAEKNAQKHYRPSIYPTPHKLKWSWKDFFLYQDPGWSHNWVVMVLMSFVGTYGFSNMLLNENVTKGYLLFLFVGGFGVLFMLREFYWRKSSVQVTWIVSGGCRLKQKLIKTSARWNDKGLFNLAMLASAITPVALFIYYAYFNDNQAQGRYILSAVYAVMYFVASGFGKLADRFLKKPARERFFRIAPCVWVLACVLVYIFEIFHYYTAWW